MESSRCNLAKPLAQQAQHNIQSFPYLRLPSLGERSRPGNLSFGFNDGDDVVGGAWHDEATGIGDNAYLGIEFLGDAGTHYGWIHIQEFAGLGGWFYEYAYEDTPERV